MLGLWEGATENKATCTALLEDLVARGLPTDRAILVVIDGGKALYRAVRSVLGRRALIQRCQEHKKRNVLDALPQSKRGSVKRWKSGRMILRWSAAGALEAERGFRRLKGYRQMTKLVVALQSHDATIDGTVEGRAAAA